MKSRFALALFAVVLVSAIPGRADTANYARLANGSSDNEFLGKTTGVAVNAKVNAGLAAQPLSETLAIGTIPVDRILSAAEANSASDLILSGLASSDSRHRAILWSDEAVLRHEILDPDRHHDRHIHHHGELMPEPGTLPMILVGLFALGLFSSRRAHTLKTS